MNLNGIAHLIIEDVSCSSLISQHLTRNCVKKIWLPSDICESVTIELIKHKIRFSYYRVNRSWDQIEKDRYQLPKIEENDWILISDLFNFMNYRIPPSIKNNIVLDLAHSSFRNLVSASELFKSFHNLKLVCISFGRGKYHRRAEGGGLGFTGQISCLETFNDLVLQSDKYHIKNIPAEILKESKYTANSTRVVLKADQFDEHRIKAMRTSGYDISDGLFDHLVGARRKEYYLWKGTQ